VSHAWSFIAPRSETSDRLVPFKSVAPANTQIVIISGIGLAAGAAALGGLLVAGLVRQAQRKR
jgi:hypothetical protein